MKGVLSSCILPISITQKNLSHLTHFYPIVHCAALYTLLYSTVYSLRFTFYTLQFTLYSLQRTVTIVHCTMYRVWLTVYSVPCV